MSRWGFHEGNRFRVLPAGRMRWTASTGNGLATLSRTHPDRVVARNAARYPANAGPRIHGRREAPESGKTGDLGFEREPADDGGLCAQRQEYRHRNRRVSGWRLPGTGHESRRNRALPLAHIHRCHLCIVKVSSPERPYRWQCKCYLDHTLADSVPALEDGERAVRLVRAHAVACRIDPRKVGVLGFSAGDFLVAALSTVFGHRLYRPVDAADENSDRPDFALAIYPGHLEYRGVLTPLLTVSRRTPLTFLVDAENDQPDGVEQSLVHYTALANAGVPAELHIYARGSHGFGLRPAQLPITHWPKLADAWLRRIDMLGK